jgi:hypothetical protein
MLGPWSLLPLLEGWDYHVYEIPVTPITKTRSKVLQEINNKGWVLAFNFLSTDCYASIILRFKGSGQRWWEREYYPELYNLIGAVQQDPGGWIQYYWRPIPASTAGIYFTVPFTGGYQGSPLPFVPKCQGEAYLRPESTQDEALISAFTETIEIIDEVAFRRSLRQIMLGIPDLSQEGILPDEVSKKYAEERKKTK